MNRFPEKSKVCSNCGHYLFYLLEGVYDNGDDELVCSKCGLGVRSDMYQNLQQTAKLRKEKTT